MAAFAYGYGVYLDNYTIDDEAADRVISMLSKVDQKQFKEVLEEKTSDPDNDQPTGEILDEWLGEGDMDVAEVLAKHINKRHFGNRKVVRGEQGCLFVSVKLPASDKDREKIPTQKEAKAALLETLRYVFKEQRVEAPRYEAFEEYN